jgi:hypothetical protein
MCSWPLPSNILIWTISVKMTCSRNRSLPWAGRENSRTAAGKKSRSGISSLFMPVCFNHSSVQSINSLHTQHWWPRHGRQNNDQHMSSLRLPIFWADNAEAWFPMVKARFRLKPIDNELDQFDHEVNALPTESLRVVLDLATHPHRTTPTQPPRKGSVWGYQLTEFQRVENFPDGLPGWQEANGASFRDDGDASNWPWG